MKIKDYVKMYYNQPEEERDINEWYPVLDKFIRSLCNKFYNVGEHDDRVQTAWIGAIKAINSYDINKGIQFTTYLGSCVYNELLMYNRKNNRKNTLIFVSMSEPLVEDASLTMEDIISDDSYLDYDEMICSNNWNDFTTNFCSDNERKILDRRMKGMSQIEISNEFGWSGQSYVSRVLKKCKRKYESMNY